MELTKNWQKIGEKVIGNAGYGNYLLRLYGRYISQSTEDNSSPVQVELRHYSPTGSITYYSSSQKITGDIEKSSTNSTNKVCYAGDTVLLTETKTIQHEEDGSKSISIGASFTNSYFGNTVTINQVSVDLPKINRLTTVVLNNGEYFYIDKDEYEPNPIPVTLNKYVDSYTTNLKLYYETSSDEGTPRYTIGERTNFNSTTLSFTAVELKNIYDAFPNTFFTRIICVVESYENGTKIGETEYISVGLISRDDAQPEFSDFEYADTNETTLTLTGNSQILVKGYSNVEMSVSQTNKAVAHKGATIKQYTFANRTPIQDITAINYPIKTEKFKPQNKELGVTAIDSRDLPVKVLKTLSSDANASQPIISWDGDLDGKEAVGNFCKVSDKIFTAEELIGKMVEITQESEKFVIPIVETEVIDDYGTILFYAGNEELGTNAIGFVRTAKQEDYPGVILSGSPGTYFLFYVEDNVTLFYVSKLIAAGNKTWIEYKDIEKISFTAERKNAGTSTEVTLKLSGNIWNGNFGKEDNSIKEAIYKYKKTTDTEWIDGTTTLNVIKNGSTYSLEQDIAGDLGATGFDQEESYDIYVEVSDQLSTVSDTFTLGAGSPGIARYKNCVALGAPYDEAIGGRVQIQKVTGTTNFETNLLKQGKEVATKEDIPVGWEDITDKDDEVIAYASNITFENKKMYRIANKFIYFVCTGTCSSSSTSIIVGTINEYNRPFCTTYAGAFGAGSQPATVSASSSGNLTVRSTSNSGWFGFSIMWAIDEKRSD